MNAAGNHLQGKQVQTTRAKRPNGEAVRQIIAWSLYLDYQGQFASHLSDDALSVGFTNSSNYRLTHTAFDQLPASCSTIAVTRINARQA